MLANTLILLWLTYRYTMQYTLLSPNDCILFNGTKVIERPFNTSTLTERFTHETVRLINNSTKPAFIVMGYDKMHTAIETSSRFVNISGNGRYNDGMMELDDSLNRIHSALATKTDNYIMIILSDNGPHREEHIYSGSSYPLRGGKGQAFDGGVRTNAAVIMVKDGIKITKKITHPVSTMDIIPTLLDLINVDYNKNEFDGRSLVNLIEDKPISPKPLFFYCGTRIHSMLCQNDLKIHFETGVFDDQMNEMCPSTTLCSCKGIKHKIPIVYNITHDMTERQPINTNIKQCLRLLEQHKNVSGKLPSVLGYYPRPWLEF